MKIKPAFLFILSVTSLLLPGQTGILNYTSQKADTLFGNVIPDPYRWMENLYSDTVEQWLGAQESITESEQSKFNGRLTIARNDIRQHAGAYMRDAEKVGNWRFRVMGPRANTGPMPVLYYRETDIDDESKFGQNFDYKVAFDPNNPKDETKYTISGWEMDDKNKYLAVMVSPLNSDWREIRVHDMETEKDLRDRLYWVKFSKIVWWGNGFFYERYKKPEKSIGQTEQLSGQQLYYHQLGETQDKDKLITAESASATKTIKIKKTSNNRYLVISLQQKINGEWNNVVFYKDLNNGLTAEMQLIAKATVKSDVTYDVIDFMDSAFYLFSNYKAPHNRILRYAIESPDHFTEVVPAFDKVLQQVYHIHHELVALYFTGGKFEVHMFNYKGEMVSGITFEGGINVSGFNGKPEDDECTFYENTFYMPHVAYRYNFLTHKTRLVHETLVQYDHTNYTTQIVKYHSKDGTEIPMYITCKKGLKINGNSPVILYGIGGDGISATPFFKYSNILFFDNNGILAVPMIRGGGEMGEDWREAGTGQNKQNAFNDFIAAAEYMVQQGYTSKEKLAIVGNGGALAGSVLVQRPDLCQVVIEHSGLFDLLRFNKFTGGRYWTREYGSPDDSTDFKNLLKYSPLQNLKPNTNYPATLFTVGDNDDRVPAFHTYKFLATLQKYSTGSKPHLLFFEEEAGHNGSSDYIDRNYEDAFVLSFIFTEMNLKLSPF